MKRIFHHSSCNPFASPPSPSRTPVISLTKPTFHRLESLIVLNKSMGNGQRVMVLSSGWWWLLVVVVAVVCWEYTDHCTCCSWPPLFVCCEPKITNEMGTVENRVMTSDNNKIYTISTLEAFYCAYGMIAGQDFSPICWSKLKDMPRNGDMPNWFPKITIASGWFGVTIHSFCAPGGYSSYLLSLRRRWVVFIGGYQF